MGYLEQSLMPGERIVYKTNLHWAMLVWTVLGFLISLVFAIGVGFIGYMALQRSQLAPCGPFFILFLVLAGIASLYDVAKVFSAYLSTEFGVTNKRVLVKMGVLHRSSSEIMIRQVESVVVDQGLLGRILDYGTIIIMGSGGTKQSFRNIAAPFELRKRLVEQIRPEKGKDAP